MASVVFKCEMSFVDAMGRSPSWQQSRGGNALYARAHVLHRKTMKWLLAMALWLWAAGPGWTAPSPEQTFTCPIDGESWKQRLETATRPSGLRLDLKKLGDVVEPPTLPQCPKCRYVMVSEGLGDPVMKKLKAFVLGGDYQMIADKSPSWACLAHLQE